MTLDTLGCLDHIDRIHSEDDEIIFYTFHLYNSKDHIMKHFKIGIKQFHGILNDIFSTHVLYFAKQLNYVTLWEKLRG